MSDFTDFLKSLTRSVDNSLPEDDEDNLENTSEEEQVDTEELVDEDGLTLSDRLAQDKLDFESFLQRSAETTRKAEESGIVFDDGPVDLSRQDPSGGIDVTKQVKAAREPTRNYEWFYGDKPKLSWMNSIGATLGDIFNPEDIPSASQQERDDYKLALEDFDTRAAEIYDNSVEYTLPEAKLLGIDLSGMADDEFFTDGKVRIYKYLDDNNNVAMALVPNPTSNAFTRIVGQAGRTIWTQVAGLVEREDDGSLDLNYLEDSEYSKAVPNYDQGVGEGLFTDLLVFGVPGLAAEKGGRTALKSGSEVIKRSDATKKIDTALGAGKIGKGVRNLSGKVDDAITYLGGSIAVAFTEGVLSEEGDEGLIFDPGEVQKLFTGLDDEESADLAMFFDGLVVNTGFDTILGLGAKAWRAGADRIRDSRGLVDKTFVRDKSKRAALLSVITEIDPTLSGKSGREIAAATRTLSKILDENSKVLVQVGSSAKEVPVDTANALAAGAKKYIQVTRQNLENTMSKEEWLKYVEDEANSIVSATIAVARANLDNTALRDKQASMINTVADTFEDEAITINPNNVEFDTQTVPDLVESRNLSLEDIDAEISAATDASTTFSKEAGTAVANDPLIKEMVEEVDPSRFFDDSSYVDQLTNLYGKVFVDEYRAAYDSVRVAYEAIPNDPIDMVSFKTQLANVFTSAGGLGEVTQDGAPILAKLQQVFEGKIASKTDNLNLTALEGGNVITPQVLIDGLSDDIGFQDLYTLKKEIDNMISSTNNRTVSASLRELRDHITSKAVNDAGEATGQLAYVSKNNAKTAELAQAADNLFIETQSKFQNSMTTQNLSDASFTPAYAGSNTPIPENGSRRGQPNLETNAVENSGAMLGDVTGNQLQQLQFALSDALSKGEVNKPFIDLFVAKQSDRLAKALRNNDTQTIEDVDAAFQGVIDQLRRLESPLVEELNAAKSRILKVQEELGSRALAADQIADLAKARKIEAENTIVSQFLSKYGPSAKSSPSKTVRTMLESDDAGGAIDALMREIDSLPANQIAPARAATQSMLLRTVHDIIRTSTSIAPGGKKDVAMGALNKITNKRASGLIDAVSRAFPNNEFMKETMMATLGSLSDVSLSARMKIARSGSDTATNLNVRDSVSTGILFVFGYMNPTAAAMRRISATQIEAMEKLAKSEQEKIIGTILSEPEEFAELARMIADGVDPSLLSTLRDNFLASANRTLQYELRVDKEGERDNQTMGMLKDSMNSAVEIVK